MQQYELIVIFHPDLEMGIDNPIAKLEKLIKDNEGKIIKRDDWGKRRLAYTIKGEDFGIYICFSLQLLPEKIRNIESNIIINEEIMRHLLVRQEKPIITNTVKNKKKPLTKTATELKKTTNTQTKKAIKAKPNTKKKERKK